MNWLVANWTAIEMLGTDRQDNMNYELSADFPHYPMFLEKEDYAKWAVIWTKHSITVGLATIRIWADSDRTDDKAFLDLMTQP